MSVAGILTVLAVAASAIMAYVRVARPPRRLLDWSFSIGMIGFALESAASFVLLTRTEAPADRLAWLSIRESASLLLVIPWTVFVAELLRPEGQKRTSIVQYGLWTGGILVGAATASLFYVKAFEVAELSVSFYAARLELPGRLSAAAQIVATVGILAGLEAALRGSRGGTRWRLKYLILGLGGLFLVRFYFLSQVALFNVVMASYMTTIAATLAIANVTIAVSIPRNRLAKELAISRQVVYRSVVGAVLGVYLVALGVLGVVMNHLGIAEELVWGSMAVFVTALALAVAMLSEAVRWRIKRFIGTHFYRSKYDYRVQWVNFTKRLGSLLTVEELAPELVRAVIDTVGTTVGVLYLLEPSSGRYHCAVAIGIGRPDRPLDAGSPLIGALRATETPLVFGTDASLDWLEPNLVKVLHEGSVAIPLRWRDELAGIMLVAAERTGAFYGDEDLQFLSTVAEQAAGAIGTARLSEALAEARAFDAFHRLTSFVIHDLKNSIGTLSMLSQNALRHFDDPEFQRDAIKTLVLTVDRMKALLGRLSTAPNDRALRTQPVELESLVLEATRPVLNNPRIAVVKELAPVAPIPGDPEALFRVIQNLVTNALQSIDGDGTVTLRTYEEERCAVFAVTDTGCGMSEEFIRKDLFSPFRSKKKGGWGIGLYQTKGIVEAHGGTIGVSSQEGAGTTFSVRLPINGGGSL